MQGEKTCGLCGRTVPLSVWWAHLHEVHGDPADERPTCDWWVTADARRAIPKGYRCDRQASFRWGDRYICANHAASWIRAGKTMTRLPGVANPYPGSYLWNLTKDEEVVPLA